MKASKEIKLDNNKYYDAGSCFFNSQKKNNNINNFKYLLLFPLIDKCSWIINLDLLR